MANDAATILNFALISPPKQFTVKAFIDALVCSHDPNNETPVVSLTIQDQNGRVVFPARRPDQTNVEKDAQHLSISVQKVVEPKQTSRIANFLGGFCLVLDDIGTKVKKPPSLEPTWIMETSPGNFQWGYAFDEILRDIDLFDRIIRATGQLGISDLGMANVVRWFRLPGSQPVGKKHPAELVHWNPKMRYCSEDLLSGLGIKELPSPKHLQPTGAVKKTADIRDPVFKWLEQEGYVLSQKGASSGYWEVLCPWADEHSDRIEEGAAYRPVGKGNALRGFTCHHSHDHGIYDFLDWVKAKGGPDLGVLIAGKDEFDPILKPESVPPESSKIVVQTTRQWVDSWSKPDYSIYRLRARKAAVYNITGPAGSGKSSVATCLARIVATGDTLDGETINQQRVLYLSGENSEDDKTRVSIDLAKRGLDPNSVHIDWIGGAFKLSERVAELVWRMENAKDAYGVVFVDSSTAFFFGDDENSNTEMHSYYQKFRQLANLSYNPTVIVLAHPAKYADAQNMVPRGGGAVYATTDGNAANTLDKHGIVTLTPMKWRGARWKPLEFELRGLSDPAFCDSVGRQVETSEAVPLTSAQAQFARHYLDLDILAVWVAQPSKSLRGLAADLDLSLDVVRGASNRLRENGYLERVGQTWKVTKLGEKALLSIR